MKVCILYSGAKDSNYALHHVKKEGHEICCLTTFYSENLESYMFHTPNIKWAEMQSEALNIPIEIFQTQGEKELELKDLKNALIKLKKKYDIKGVVSGAIESKYQKERINKICNLLGLKSINPIWKVEPEKYIKTLVNKKFKVKIVGVFAEGLNKDWLGKDLNENTIEDLKNLNKKYKVHLAGEGGEYETFVYDSPDFKKRINIMESEKIWDGDSGILKIKKAKLIEK